MDYFNREQPEIFKLEIDAAAKSNFLEMSRWTKFLAVMGFVMLGIGLIAGIGAIFFLSSYSDANGGGFGALGNGKLVSIILIPIIVLVIAVYFYPTYALYKYSSLIKSALLTDNKEEFNSAIRYLKSMFKYMGILMIVVLVMYTLQIIISLLVASKT